MNELIYIALGVFIGLMIGLLVAPTPPAPKKPTKAERQKLIYLRDRYKEKSRKKEK